MASIALPPNNKPRVYQVSRSPFIHSFIYSPNRLSSPVPRLLGPNASADGKSSRAMDASTSNNIPLI